VATPHRTPQQQLAQLDARHDELLSRLDDLNQRILAALAELVPADQHNTRNAEPAAVATASR
jgi:hypothetical protein